MRWTVAGGEHYERNLTGLLCRLATLLDRPVFYDVGASYGFYTFKLARCSEWVYAFEPVTTTFGVLRRNVEHTKIRNITAFQLGLLDVEAELPISLYSSSGTNSLLWALPPEHPAKLIGREVIRVGRLDDVAERHHLRPPDVMKFDVEGAELPALRGGRALIARSKPVLVLESRCDGAFDPGYSRDALLDELYSAGYVVAGLSADYDDVKLYPVEEFESRVIVNIVSVPVHKKDLLHEFM
jgi:FkbM family methyltransferase